MTLQFKAQKPLNPYRTQFLPKRQNPPSQRLWQVGLRSLFASLLAHYPPARGGGDTYSYAYYIHYYAYSSNLAHALVTGCVAAAFNVAVAPYGVKNSAIRVFAKANRKYSLLSELSGESESDSKRPAWMGWRPRPASLGENANPLMLPVLCDLRLGCSFVRQAC